MVFGHKSSLNTVHKLVKALYKCPEWGSNPHWEDFKSSASAIGLSGPCETGVYWVYLNG